MIRIIPVKAPMVIIKDPIRTSHQILVDFLGVKKLGENAPLIWFLLIVIPPKTYQKSV